MLEIIKDAVFQSINIILSFLLLIATIIIAVLASIIAKRQLKLQNYQLKYDLYNRRYEYYEKLKSIYEKIKIDPERTLNENEYKKLKENATNELKFIFDDDIVHLFNRIHETLEKLCNYKVQEIVDKESFETGKKPKSSERQNIQNEWKEYYIQMMNKIEDLLIIRNLK